MKESKAVHVTKRDLYQNFYDIHEIYLSKADRDIYILKCTENNRDIGCQFDSNKNKLICTCRNVSTYRRRDRTYFSGLPKQIYTYHGVGRFTDVGVGNVKVLQKKKVKRVYLPETEDRGVGNEGCSTNFSRRHKQSDNGTYYKNKRISSKCVGGVVNYKPGSMMSQKLSPIIRTRSGTTSPFTASSLNRNVNIGRNAVELTTTQVENNLLAPRSHEATKLYNYLPSFGEMEKSPKVSKDVDNIQGINCTEKKLNYMCRITSSDSLIQHVHNLENPSVDKNILSSLDHLKNKLEKEYRNPLSSTRKENKVIEEPPRQELKSASFLRRRFEALRKGFVKKEYSRKTDVIGDKMSIQISRHSRRDVSIVSDPPSLEGRSFSNMKPYRPIYDNFVPENPNYDQTIINSKSYPEKERDITQWSLFDQQDSDCQGVKGMFRLWGKKFNLEEDCYKKTTSPIPSCQIIESTKISEQVKDVLKTEPEDRKENKKFFFFKRKTKEKSKGKVKPKKSVTAGRCELSQGLMIKIPGNSPPLEEKNNNNIPEGVLEKHWLVKYLSQNIESRNSVQIRWNNSTYSTKSSTVFELMDTIYKETGMVFRSKNEVTTGESSYYTSCTQCVNFGRREIEAWMIPKTQQVERQKVPLKVKSESKDNIKLRISNQKWYIEKSKSFSNKIEVVLHSNNLVKRNKNSNSSEYLRIDIPKGFFIDSSSSEEDAKNQSTDEEVYNIVEYETQFDSKKNMKKFETGDHKLNDIQVVVNVKGDLNYESNIKETVIKGPPAHRDVVIQGSNVNVPKRCNVIEVGIITQSDLREAWKPVPNVTEFLSDEESDIEVLHTPKKCEFAESFLQEYYRNWTPLGTDVSSWCASDSNIKCWAEISESSFHNQCNGPKSCPNIYDDFQASAIVSSNDPCGACMPCPFMIAADDEKPDSIFTSKLFKKFKNKTKSGPHDCCKRVLPKDSLEVFKRRKIYAASNKSKWASPSYGDVKLFSIPSNEDKEAQDTMKDCPKSRNPNYGPFVVKPKKTKCKKHVSMPDYETMNKALSHQLTNDTPEGILTFKGVGGCEKCKKLEQKCPKHAVLDRDSACKIPDPLCKEMCLKDKKAPCSTTSSKSGGSPLFVNRPKSSMISGGSPTPCKPPLACKPSPTLNPPLPCSPPPPCMPKPSLCSSKLPSVTKKCSPIPPPSKKSSSLCKKCHSKTTSNKQTLSSPKNSRPTTPPCCKKISITHNSSPTCPNFFPSCKKTQSTQTSPKHSVDNSYSKVSRNNDSPHSIPHKKARPLCCIHGNDSDKKEKESSSHSSICNTTPCRKVSPQINKLEDKCPHSLKDQRSNQPSLESVICRPKHEPSRKKNVNQCKKEYPLSPNLSNQSLLPKKRKNKEKECMPNCVNMPKMQELAQCPPPSTCSSVLNCPPLPRKPESSKPIISGIFLKMKPSMKKTCSKDCLGWQEKNNESTIKLSSNEKITIIVKKQTPSTEEIREGMNIKVKDIDGQTLYERRDYVQDHRNQADSILGDMYKSSHIYTVSTPTIIKNVQTSNSKNQMLSKSSRSDTSITNLIEIQFKLKVAQGDKNTEINIANANGTKAYVNESDQKQSHEVFVARNNGVNYNQGVPSENDVNIRIIIKNYKPNVKMKKNECNDDFTKKISEKFRTVSIGYSDVCPVQNADNVYSLQRTTVDLKSSTEKYKAKSCPSIECNSSELVEQEHNNFTDISNSSKLSKSENKNELENYKTDISSNRNLRIKSHNFKTNIQNENYKPIPDTEHQISDINTSAITSNEIIEKPISIKEKKELLRKIFEKANHTKPKNKSKMKKLRDMLKMILTSDSSGPEDLAVTSNELAKDVTYASLKPNYFRDTDSMNNYYNTDSKKSLKKQSVQKYHPTDEKNSECSVSSQDSIGMEGQGCMCSTLAEKLNICKAGENSCCCRRTTTRNEEACCDIGDEDHFLVTNLNKSELVDKKRQNSTCVSTENNSNLKLKRKESNLIKNYPAVLTQHEVITTSGKVVNIGKSIHSSTKKHRKVECNVKVNKTATLHISSRDETILVKTKSTRSADVKETEKKNRDEDRKKKNHCEIKRNEIVMTNLNPQADILQSYETKRAVLQIYTENAMSDNREHFVAKLPKFAQFTENKIKNYESIVTNYRNVSKKNVVMSVQR